MTDALQNPHPEVPFARIGDDTISALAELAAIFKLKLQQAPPPTLPSVPPKVTQRPCLAESSNPILSSPLPLRRQTRSQTTIQTQDITNAPLPPRVVTPRTLGTSPPRVPSRSQRLSPRNLSQNDFCGMDTAHIAIALGDNHWSQQHQANAVIHLTTGKEMEYMALMKDPHLQPLWQRGFGNECGRLFQGIRDIPGTDICFFIKLTNIPKDRKITLLMPLNDIATEQTTATEKKQAATNKLLDYLATHPDATIRYHVSDMVLHIHSDDSYLSVSNAGSRLGGLFFLGNKPPEQDTLNGSILNVASVIKYVVASAAESEVGACFHNAWCPTQSYTNRAGPHTTHDASPHR
jgi:hypothetical protein